MEFKHIEEFVFFDDWFSQKYKTKMDSRFPTFRLALNLFLQMEGQVIVETGCVRKPEDWGAGCSTLLFSEVLYRYGGHLWSVDIDERNVRFADKYTYHFRDSRTLICGDSVEFLRQLANVPNFPGSIDLLYLDSMDYPIGDHPSDFLIDAPQQHSLAELNAALSYLHDRSMVMIDDNTLPQGGKAKLAKRQLLELGWTCLFDYQQTLWIKM